MTLFSRRLPHVLTHADLARVVAPTYAEALNVEDDEAHDRVSRAIERPGVADDLYRGISEALARSRGPRTTEDAQLDKLSAGVVARRARVKAAPASPAISAVLVRMNLELGLAPEGMRATLATDKGRAMLDDGLRALGAHLAKELLK
ncbi:MAG: hypothetical protein ACJ79R_17550 [Anaeromyxobacteraceae bacterium]